MDTTRLIRACHTVLASALAGGVAGVIVGGIYGMAVGPWVMGVHDPDGPHSLTDMLLLGGYAGACMGAWGGLTCGTIGRALGGRIGWGLGGMVGGSLLVLANWHYATEWVHAAPPSWCLYYPPATIGGIVGALVGHGVKRRASRLRLLQAFAAYLDDWDHLATVALLTSAGEADAARAALTRRGIFPVLAGRDLSRLARGPPNREHVPQRPARL
ncbi:MAG: hypothetical protein HY321_04650, partial [Armatimonadetes bacterium]|nr:hypothetical protein [Armatimonadota bacterium]